MNTNQAREAPLDEDLRGRQDQVRLTVTIQLTPEIRHFCAEKWSFTRVNSHFSAQKWRISGAI